MLTFGRGHCALFVERPFGKEARAKKSINAAEPIKAGEPLLGTDQHRTEPVGAAQNKSAQLQGFRDQNDPALIAKRNSLASTLGCPYGTRTGTT